MGNNHSALTVMLTVGAVGMAAYMMMPHKRSCELEEGMRKAADELQGVSKELGKAIKSIGETMA